MPHLTLLPPVLRELRAPASLIPLALLLLPPWTLSAQTPALGFAAFVGGTGYDAVHAVTTDAAGNLYVTGEAASPVFSGCGGPPPSRGRDAFIVKFTPGGTSAVFCVLFGGNGADAGRAIAVDAQGNIYAAGSTTSADFPVTAGAYRPAATGQGEAFVVKVSPAGQPLYAALLGGSGLESAMALGVDTAGSAYVGGYTNSLDFATSSGALQVSARGATDGFLAKLNAAGTSLVYATFLGGNAADGVNALSVASDGSVWAGGYTESPDFPGNVQQRLRDGFVVQLNSTGTALLKALGVTGMGEDAVNALHLDSQGRLTAGGVTSSVDFLTTSGAVKKAGKDGFVCQWNVPSGTLRYATLIGGAGADAVAAVTATPDGRIWAAGPTSSIDFPMLNPIQATAGSTADAWVAALNTTGTAWVFSSYLRGAAEDAAASLAASGQRVWVAGSTMSAGFPATGEGMQPVHGGNMDGWLARLTEAAGPEILAVSPSAGTGGDQTFTFEIGHAGGYSKFNNFSINFSSPLAWAQACHVTVYRSGTVALLADNGSSFVSQGQAGAATILRNSQCSVDLGSASFRAAGNTINVSLRIAFQASFASVGGSTVKGVRVTALDNLGASTGWVQVGTWGVPYVNAAPVLSLITPNQGAGMAQRFRFVIHDDNGSADLRTISVVIGSNLHWDRACFFTFWTSNNILGLANDAATGYVAGFLPGTQGIVANSQCSLNAAESVVVVDGPDIRLDVSVSFLPAFATVDGSAAKKIYTYVGDASGANTGWTQSGAWTMAASSAAPTVSPISAFPSGSSAVVSFKVSDVEGYRDIAFTTLNIAAPLQSAGSCVVTYVAALGQLGLLNDAGTGYVGYLTPGAGQLSNSQCTLSGASSVAWGTGNDLFFRLALTLTSTFMAANGPVKGLYVAASDANWANLPYTRVGTWAVPSTDAAPTIASVTPANGSGPMGTFTFTIRDPNGSQNLSNMSVIVANPLSWTNSCFFTVFTDSGILALSDDTATSYVAVLFPGTATSMGNSQCEVRADLSSYQRTDYEAKLTVTIAFKTAYASAGAGATKRVYAYAVDKAGLNTGWQTFGSWLIQ